MSILIDGLMDWHFVNVDKSGLTCSTAKGIGGGIVLGEVWYASSQKSSHLFVDDSTCTKRARVVFSLSCPESQVGSNPAKKFSTLAS